MDLKVSYLGYSPDNLHPADRRRFINFAKRKKIKLESNPRKSDLIIATPLHSFSKVLELKNSSQKLLLDLVDGYLFESQFTLINYGRGLIRSKNPLGLAKGFYRQLEDFVAECDSVVVASEEQAKRISIVNRNVTDILDYHSEIPELIAKEENSRLTAHGILWEGQSSNLKHILPKIKRILESQETDAYFNILTNLKHYRIANKYFKTDVYNILKKKFPSSIGVRLNLHEWSLNAIEDQSADSWCAVIPIDLNDSFANAKPENKLLGMWRLDLPTFVSPIESYIRVLNELGLSKYLIEQDNWQKLPKKNAVLSDWRHERLLVREFLNATNEPGILDRKWEGVINSL